MQCTLSAHLRACLSAFHTTDSSRTEANVFTADIAIIPVYHKKWRRNCDGSLSTGTLNPRRGNENDTSDRDRIIGSHISCRKVTLSDRWRSTANLFSANMFGIRKQERCKKFDDIENTLSCLWTDRERRRTTDIPSDDSTCRAVWYKRLYIAYSISEVTNVQTSSTFNVRLRASSWLHLRRLGGGDVGEDGGCWGGVSLLSDGDVHVLTQRVGRLAVMSRLSPNISMFDRRSVSNSSQMSASAADSSACIALRGRSASVSLTVS